MTSLGFIPISVFFSLVSSDGSLLDLILSGNFVQKVCLAVFISIGFCFNNSQNHSYCLLSAYENKREKKNDSVHMTVQE